MGGGVVFGRKNPPNSNWPLPKTWPKDIYRFFGAIKHKHPVVVRIWEHLFDSDDHDGDAIGASNDGNGGDDELGCKTISFEVSKAAIIVSGNCEAHEATKLASAAKLNSAVLLHIYALHNAYITNP